MTTKLPPPGADDVLYLVDLCSIARAYFHGVPEAFALNGEPVHATRGALGFFVSLFRRGPGYLGVAVDPEGATFRHELWSDYKAKRPPRPASYSAQLTRLCQVLTLHRVPLFAPPTFEADDAIATAVARALPLGLRVVVVSRDHDLAQLVGERVVLWNGLGGDRSRVQGPEEVRAHFGVGPELLPDLFALAGDASDGIPGLDGIGEKTAAEWLTRFGSLAEVLRKGPSWLEPSVRRRTLSLNIDRVRLFRTLTGLRTDAPIDFNLAELRDGGYDVDALRAVYRELGFDRDPATAGWLDVEAMPKRPPGSVGDRLERGLA
jgi:DNA polymerase-1